MERLLIGQEAVYQTMDSIVKDPPHLFITGPFGYGKSSLGKQFLKTYMKQFDIQYEDSEWLLHLSSDSDRGIHRVREGVAEFVRHSSSRPGVYRWIFVDDSDTLPIVSQQALRRPMETHAHTTRFIFCSRYVGDLITPLRSRCLHLEINAVALNDIIVLKDVKPSLKSFLINTSHSPRDLFQYLNCIEALGPDLNEADFILLFSSASDTRIKQLVLAFLKIDKNKCLDLLFDIWDSGTSYEDFLTDMSSCVKNLGFLSPDKDQMIHELIIQGWIYYTDGRTHLVDILSLFRELWLHNLPEPE